MDFTVELDDDEVLTLTVDETPRKKVRIQVESLTVRGKLPDRQCQRGTTVHVGDLFRDELVTEKDPAWMRGDIEAVLLAHMRDYPKNKTSVDAAAQLESSDFQSKRYGIMFLAIRSLMLKGRKVTSAHICQEAATINSTLPVQAWFADAVGGDNDDVSPDACLTWILARRLIDEK